MRSIPRESAAAAGYSYLKQHYYLRTSPWTVLTERADAEEDASRRRVKSRSNGRWVSNMSLAIRWADGSCGDARSWLTRPFDTPSSLAN